VDKNDDNNILINNNDILIDNDAILIDNDINYNYKNIKD